MTARIFSLANPQFEIPETCGLQFSWASLDGEIGLQVAFQEQFLCFYRYLYENLQSTPKTDPNQGPYKLSLSLRAGALKIYILAACSIIEGVLAELAAMRDLGDQEELHRLSFGRLLQKFERERAVLDEFQPIWGHLKLLKKYRNFVHLGNAAKSEQAYWRDILDQEANLLDACDESIRWLSDKCCASR